MLCGAAGGRSQKSARPRPTPAVPRVRLRARAPRLQRPPPAATARHDAAAAVARALGGFAIPGRGAGGGTRGRSSAPGPRAPAAAPACGPCPRARGTWYIHTVEHGRRPQVGVRTPHGGKRVQAVDPGLHTSGCGLRGAACAPRLHAEYGARGRARCRGAVAREGCGRHARQTGRPHWPARGGCESGGGGCRWNRAADTLVVGRGGRG